MFIPSVIHFCFQPLCSRRVSVSAIIVFIIRHGRCVYSQFTLQTKITFSKHKALKRRNFRKCSIFRTESIIINRTSKPKKKKDFTFETPKFLVQRQSHTKQVHPENLSFPISTPLTVNGFWPINVGVDFPTRIYNHVPNFRISHIYNVIKCQAFKILEFEDDSRASYFR